MADSEGNENKIHEKCSDYDVKDKNKADCQDIKTDEPYLQYQTSFNQGGMHHRAPGEYRNAREYAQAVQSWIWQYRMWMAVSSFQSQLISAMPQPSHLHQHSPLTFTSMPGQDATSVTDLNLNGQAQGTIYKIPMIWRRIAAEFLDFILLFYTKILVTVAVLRQMGYVNENLLDLEAQFPILSDVYELDYEKMFTLTSELIALEIINRLCITLVETMCIRQGYAGSIGGATPGKKIMQLRVLSFDEVRDLRNGQIQLIGARDPGFMNALIRSVIKNFSLAFFFPACFTVFFFRFNRAAYDVMTQTVVVEVEHVRRRR